MKRKNVIGSSKGFVERVCESYTSVEVKNVRGRLQNKNKLILFPFQLRKYFLSCLKFMALYKTGETGSTVFQAMAKQRKKHREGAIFGPVDHSKKVYSRKRTFIV